MFGDVGGMYVAFASSSSSSTRNSWYDRLKRLTNINILGKRRTIYIYTHTWFVSFHPFLVIIFSYIYALKCVVQESVKNIYLSEKWDALHRWNLYICYIYVKIFLHICRWYAHSNIFWWCFAERQLIPITENFWQKLRNIR